MDGPSKAQIPAVIFACRSKAEAEGKNSTGDQVEEIRPAIEREGSRVIVGEPYVDFASGYRSSRGPNLAAAIAKVTALADKYGRAELWVWKCDRLGRGSGRRDEALSLLERMIELKRASVTVRSVTDDEFATTEILWSFASKQASDYSETLTKNVTRGKAARARNGNFCGSRAPDGYLLELNPDAPPRKDGSRPTRLVKDSERAYVIDLIFAMAREGRTAEAIQLALSAEGVRTAPVRGVSRPFTTQAVSRVLNNGAYAGIVTYRGEELPGVQAQWETYLEPEEWRAFQRDRARRAGTTKRSRGRQPTQHLLRGIARCGVCGGPMVPQTERRARKDGTRRRYYECRAAREHHADAAEWCAGPRIDAAVADPTMLDGLDGVLSDAMGWREALAAGRRGE
ncbi:MAG TPA: recombinase family protein, partial [Solirubrobacteraceae bacterium]